MNSSVEYAARTRGLVRLFSASFELPQTTGFPRLFRRQVGLGSVGGIARVDGLGLGHEGRGERLPTGCYGPATRFITGDC